MFYILQVISSFASSTLSLWSILKIIGPNSWH
jgi:hypothetical protein